jgi:hypothetical protein
MIARATYIRVPGSRRFLSVNYRNVSPTKNHPSLKSPLSGCQWPRRAGYLIPWYHRSRPPRSGLAAPFRLQAQRRARRPATSSGARSSPFHDARDDRLALLGLSRADIRTATVVARRNAVLCASDQPHRRQPAVEGDRGYIRRSFRPWLRTAACIPGISRISGGTRRSWSRSLEDKLPRWATAGAQSTGVSREVRDRGASNEQGARSGGCWRVGLPFLAAFPPLNVASESARARVLTLGDRSTNVDIRMKDNDELADPAERRRLYLRKYKRRQRAQARLQGLCLVCVREPVDDRTVCARCSQRSVQWQRAHGWSNALPTEA